MTRFAQIAVVPSPGPLAVRTHGGSGRSVEFHRRLEQKWATRIDQILTVAANATPDPNEDDDEEDEEDEKDEERDVTIRAVRFHHWPDQGLRVSLVLDAVPAC